jgi:hypothetical protein
MKLLSTESRPLTPGTEVREDRLNDYKLEAEQAKPT